MYLIVKHTRHIFAVLLAFLGSQYALADVVPVALDYKYLDDHAPSLDTAFCLQIDAPAHTGSSGDDELWQGCVEAADIKGFTINSSQSNCVPIHLEWRVSNEEDSFLKVFTFHFGKAKSPTAVVTASFSSGNSEVSVSSVVAACRAVFHRFPPESQKTQRRTETSIYPETMDTILDLSHSTPAIDPDSLGLSPKASAMINGFGLSVSYDLPRRFQAEVGYFAISRTLNMDAFSAESYIAKVRFFPWAHFYGAVGFGMQKVKYSETLTGDGTLDRQYPTDTPPYARNKALNGYLETIGTEYSVGAFLLGGWKQKGLSLSADFLGFYQPSRVTVDHLKMSNATAKTRDDVAHQIGRVTSIYLLRGYIGYSF